MSVRWAKRDVRTTVEPGTAVHRSGVGAVWVGLVVSAVVLVLLLIFILQNPAPVRIAFLGWDGSLQTGISLLFAAVAGGLVVAVPGSMRILQLRRQALHRIRADHDPGNRS